MNPADSELEPPIGTAVDSGAVAHRASDWLWHPWYAKLWWAAIPIYWIPAGSPFGIDYLAGFYNSGISVYLDIVFLPVTALVVLGFGYARRLRESEHWVEITDSEHNRASAFYRRSPYSAPAYADSLSPLSGPRWIWSRQSRARREGR
ncbi:MAG: hypothetical protein JWL96_1678 [Sphingomonas bacterium]|uniref:hypothetical protein n=1 Tax=Sphingomonas bacterium TaxID=1895847 RepID=UPI00262A934E|nr:hypothetical protein [Sphingomonas bacterium]MDB5709608.1 hypothetical protein [Sphingomonas bacterium]